MAVEGFPEGIPQSKIRDFCQPPFTRGPRVRCFTYTDKGKGVRGHCPRNDNFGRQHGIGLTTQWPWMISAPKVRGVCGHCLLNYSLSAQYRIGLTTQWPWMISAPKARGVCGHCPPNYNLSSPLTKGPCGGYNGIYIGKSCEGKSTRSYPVREPRQVRGGTVNGAEDGPGAWESIGRLPRVRPLTRFEAKVLGDCHTSLRTGSQ